MPKNRKSSKKISLITNFLDKFSPETWRHLSGWLLIIATTFFLVSLIANGGIITLKIKNFLLNSLGWASYLFVILSFIFGYWLLTSLTSEVVIKRFLALSLLILIFSFIFHLIFREGGTIGELILGLSKYISLSGLILVSLVCLFFCCWLIWEQKFFNFLKNIFTQTKDNLSQIEKSFRIQTIKQEEPIKTVKKEISNNNKITDIKERVRLKTKKATPKSVWKLPSLDLLVQGKEEVLAPDIKTTSQIIQKTLENFGLKVEVVDVEIGPAITRFALKPGEGVKLSRILSYQSDLGLALGTPNLIIETPIPGKAVIGVQVPNKKTANVRLGNLLREKEFADSDSLLIFPVGRKINGESLFADLSKMPHLLIAGSTGSGKSIFIHNLIISFLLKNTPDTLNLILVDPKRVELSHYNELPHLILDPVVDVKKTLAVFNWLIEEMEERYKLLEETKSRDIDIYNRKQLLKKEKIMPRIVLFIDEMADLMVTYGSSIESMIIRLAQMARATGIHLVLATQRPSVDIVTGLIKANIPNRICFKVASYVDSRTVLDISGAEKLTGAGDGLFISTMLHRPLRVKSAFVSEAEIERVTNFWKDQAESLPNFERQTISIEEIEKRVISLDEEMEDESLLKQAVEIVLESNKASTSLLQRRLKIGYARAARLLDLMEEKGIVGPQEGSKPRKVLITKEAIDSIEI
ncbi:MAG: DNA translocase FtsK [Patescibacteria group bacterium]|nr:DNA translocase FtsK [Patescibacteria group bacterium]